MTKPKLPSRLPKYSIPRRSKHQSYMNIVPILPDFTQITQHIEKIRTQKDNNFENIKQEDF